MNTCDQIQTVSVIGFLDELEAAAVFATHWIVVFVRIEMAIIWVAASTYAVAAISRVMMPYLDHLKSDQVGFVRSIHPSFLSYDFSRSK